MQYFIIKLIQHSQNIQLLVILKTSHDLQINIDGSQYLFTT